METLKAAKRDMSIKAKKLRKSGFVPASVTGREMKESLNISISEKDAEMFMKKNVIGSKAVLDVEGTVYNVLLKSADFDPLKHRFLEMTFQQLVADEKIKSQAEIIFEHEDLAKGFITRTVSEIEYKAYPKDMVDKIVIDLSQYPIGTSLTVADLDLAKNPDVDILTSLEGTVLHVAEHSKDAAEAEEEETEAEPQA